jgi:hypothetical protein
MSHHPAVARIGFTGRNAAVAASFMRAMGLQGVPEAKAVKVLEAYARAFGPNARVGIEDVSPWLEYAASRNAWGSDIVDAAASWFTTVHEAGGDPEVIRSFDYQPPVHDDRREARIAEIRQLNRSNPDAYDSNPALQAEYLALLEQSNSSPVPSPAGGDGAADAPVSQDVETVSAAPQLQIEDQT